MVLGTADSLGQPIPDVLYVQNKDNDLFSLSYRFDMGRWNNKLLSVAASYIDYLVTDKYSAEEISKNFYRLACTYSINVQNDITTINLTGLQQNFAEATALMEYVLVNCKPDDKALSSLREGILKSRSNAKLNKDNVLRGLRSYGLYGAKNPFNDCLSNDEIDHIKADELIAILYGITQFKHQVLYYGPMTAIAFTASISAAHKLPAVFTPYLPKSIFANVATEPQVLFAKYDMVQTEISWIRNSGVYDSSREALVEVFNNYFGGGMNSVVFQTLRESKALAYSTYAYYTSPGEKEEHFTTMAYIGCQADKMTEAMQGMNELLSKIPVSEQRFELAKSSFKKDLQTQRITGEDILDAYLQAQRKGLKGDFRKMEYLALDSMSLKNIEAFHASQISGKAYTYCVIGSEAKRDKEALKKFGEVKTLSLNEIFGY